MTNRDESEQVKVLRFRFSTRLNDVIFPIDGRELVDALQKEGYTIVGQVPPARARSIIHFRGELARKNGIAIDGVSETGVLGVTAQSFEAAIKGYDELASIARDLRVDIDERSRFFEIIAEYEIESPKNPLESISRSFSDHRIATDLGDIFGQKTAMYSLRLVTAGRIPNQEEWLDVTIEPNLIKPTSTFSVSVVFRSKDKQQVLNFGETLETNVSLVVKAI